MQICATFLSIQVLILGINRGYDLFIRLLASDHVSQLLVQRRVCLLAIASPLLYANHFGPVRNVPGIVSYKTVP